MAAAIHQRLQSAHTPTAGIQSAAKSERFGKRSDYDILGLAHTATDAEIKSAYRRLMKENHPDKHPDNVEAATKRTQEINAAYASIRRVKGFK
jgi:DnaJ-domain-containing protein 1